MKMFKMFIAFLRGDNKIETESVSDLLKSEGLEVLTYGKGKSILSKYIDVDGKCTYEYL